MGCGIGRLQHEYLGEERRIRKATPAAKELYKLLATASRTGLRATMRADGPRTTNGEKCGRRSYSSTIGRPKSASGVPGLGSRAFFGAAAFVESLGAAVFVRPKSAAVGFFGGSAPILGGCGLGESSRSMPSRRLEGLGTHGGLRRVLFLRRRRRSASGRL